MNPLQLRIESLENRVLLDGALGSELAGFASEAELTNALMDRAVQQHQWRFDQPVHEWWRCGIDFCPEIAFDVDFGSRLADGGGGEIPSFSDTNTQVAGVDEGDIVETDGEYIYMLSNNMVTIVDVRELAHPRVASRYKLEANTYGSDMYLDGDRLMVISDRGWYGGPIPFVEPGLIDVEIDFAPGFWAPAHRSSVITTVIDVSDREEPQLVSRTEVDGSLANSRVVDGTAYIVLDEYLNFPMPAQLPAPPDVKGEDPFASEFVYESEASYRARVGTQILDVMPNYVTKDVDDRVQAAGLVSDYTSTFTLGDPNTSSILSVFTVDMQAEMPTVDDGNSILTTTGREMFMSRENLYLFQHKWNETQQTQIIKLDVDAENGDIKPIASGVVPGRMLNQFSADEYKGDLRIATTVGWGEESSSGVYVLNNGDGADLEIKGSVVELAPTEQIFSARFMGDRAYIVTFRQTDPLFAIDMSDPTAPEVKGELKIDGFSTYMQPIDANHMIGLGRDADPRTGRAEELQLSLFDVTDMTDPQLVDRFTYESDWTWSAAEHDHHAFRYFAEQGKLAIPVTSQDNGAWMRDEEGGRLWVPAIYNHALHVFQVDTDEGFSFTGAVEHPSQVNRSVRVGDALYSISQDTFKANMLNDLETQLGKIYYLPPANGGVFPTDPQPADVDRLFDAAEESFSKEFDMDGNSLVNTDDVSFIVEAVVDSQYGDTNLDGDVDFTDFLQLSANFGQSGDWADGDFNGDGEIGFDDFIVLSKNFGK